MTKIAITADLHFRAKRLADIKMGWDELINHLIEKKATHLLIAGDVFHDFNIAGREASFGTIYHAFKSGLNRLIEQGQCKGVYIIPGNHDIAGPNDKDALESLDGAPMIHVMRTPSYIDILDGIRVQFLPWLSDLKSYSGTDLIPPAPPGRRSILIGHCEVEGTVIKDQYSLFGGHFEFKPVDLTTKGYDYIALGHIHKKIDNYIGAPWHLGFGDAGSPTGFTMLTVENGEIQNETIELLNSPRYQIYDDAPNNPNHRKNDYIRIDYHGDAPDVTGMEASGIELQKIPDKDDVQARVEIDQNASVRDLLATWLRANDKEGVDVDELIQYADPEALCNYQLSLSSGSLQRIRNITLKHMGPHTETSISFNGEKFIAVAGHNGSGKSFAMDSIVASPFGEFPSRKDSLMTHVTQGYEGESEVSITFDCNNKTYCAQRILNKGKQKAYLNLMNNGDSTLIAGPKVTNYEREMYKLLGDKRLLLSSVFSAQGNKGDIVDASRTERKEILGNILGISGLTEISEQAKAKLIQSSAETSAASTIIEQIKALEPEENIKHRTSTILQHQATLQALATEAQDCADKIAAAEEEGKNCSAEKAKIEAAVDTLKLVITEISALQRKKQDALQEVKKKQAVVAGENDTLKKLEKINDAKLEYEKYRDAETRNLKAKEQQLLCDRDIIQTSETVNNEQRRLEGEIRLLRERGTDTKKSYEAKITRIGQDITNLQKKQQLLSQAGCKDSPMPCVFIEDGLSAEKEIQEKRLEQKDLTAQLNTLTNKNNIAIDNIERQLLNSQYAIEARSEIVALHKKRAGIIFEDVDYKITVLKETIASEAVVCTQHQQIQTAKALLEELDKKIEELNNEIMEKLKRQGELETKAQGHDEILAKYNRLKEEWRMADTQRGNIHKQQIELNKSVATIESEIERFKEKIEDRKLLEIKISANREARKNYTMIAEAFGKNGIQQLLIASALPQIQDILNSLLEELDNKFYIKFSTEGETKGGKAIETLDILVSDSRGERDIGRFSGGEQKLLRSVIRIALAIFQSQRSGSKYEVFVIDEAFDSLDRENALKMLKILLKLEDRFNQIFVVSHTDDLLVEFPARINFNTINGVSTYEFTTN